MKLLEMMYQDTQIHFLLGTDKNVMINATEMAKLFDKRIDVFLKSDHAKAFIDVLEFTPYGVNSTPLSKDEIVKPNHRHGTYFHRLLALKFAAWLDPRFEVWIYSKIEEILFGNTKIYGEKVSEIQSKKQKVEELVAKVRESGDETAIALLENLDQLKKLEADKKKAMMALTNQFRLQLDA